MDVLAVVPAVPSLGQRPFAGRPPALLALEQARAAQHVTRVAVCTRDSALTQAAAAAGADLIVPVPVAADTPVAQLRSVFEALGSADGFAPALAILLDPSFPLRATDTINDAIDHLWRCGADSLIAVHPLEGTLWSQDESGLAHEVDGPRNERRYVQTEALAGVRVGLFAQTGELPAGRTVLFEVPALAALRLRADADWSGPELLLRQMLGARGRARLRPVQLLVFDFDGVMTDNRVLVLEDGREAVLCNRGDGLGLGLLAAAGVALAVISKERNPVVSARCRKLGIPCEQGIEDKLGVLQRMAGEGGLTLAEVAYMGNDVNDLACMHAAGVAIAPADAHPEALRAADLVTGAAGGMGAVREICDLILAARADAQGAG